MPSIWFHCCPLLLCPQSFTHMIHRVLIGMNADMCINLSIHEGKDGCVCSGQKIGIIGQSRKVVWLHHCPHHTWPMGWRTPPNHHSAHEDKMIHHSSAWSDLSQPSCSSKQRDNQGFNLKGSHEHRRISLPFCPSGTKTKQGLQINKTKQL